jgi:alkanesulfonate monooxygenase SsuD/methylene tetrahydromethanopterin reductase-like flavin-dependent oxidoreductase (luciferase family)
LSEIKFGHQIYYLHSYDFFRKKVIAASKENWDSLWLPDHLTGMSGALIDDFLSVWALFGSMAELVKGKSFGTAVTDPHRIHPAVLAQLCTSINHLTKGNFILGIGAGEAMNLKAYGIPHAHALSKMRESIKFMKLSWEKGRDISFKGQHYNAEKARLLPTPVSEIPIWIGANSPKTLKLTGEIADGWMPVGIDPITYKKKKEVITTAMKENGRDLEKFTFGVFQFTYINDDEKIIESRVRASKYGLLNNPQRIKELGYWKGEYDDLYLQVTGFKSEELNVLKIDREDVAKFDYSKLEPILNEIPDELIRESAMIGSKEEIIKKIRRYVEAGADYFIFSSNNGASSKNAPFTYWDASRIISEEIIPLFKNSNV